MNHKDNLKASFDKEYPDWSPEELWPQIESSLPKKHNRIFFTWLVWALSLSALGTIIFAINLYQQQNYTAYNQMLDQKTTKTNNAIKEPNCSQTVKSEKNSRYLNKNKNQHKSYAKTNFYFTNSDSNSIPITSKINVDKLSSFSKMKGCVNEIEVFKIGSTRVQSDINSVQLNEIISDVNLLDKEKSTITEISPLVSNLRLMYIDKSLRNKSHQFSNTTGIKINRWAISVSAGVYITSRTIASTDIDNKSYIEFKMKHEKMLEALNSGVLINYQFKNLRLGIGLQMDRYTELFEAQDIKTNIVQIESDSAFYIRTNGVTEYFRGNINQKHIVGKNIKSPNTFTRWSVPVEFGYAINHFGKFAIYPHVGICLNFHSKYSGVTIAKDLNFIYSDQNKIQELYKSSGVHSFYGGLNSEVEIYKNVTLFGGIRFQKDVSNILKVDLNTSYKFSILGVNIGFQYQW